MIHFSLWIDKILLSTNVLDLLYSFDCLLIIMKVIVLLFCQKNQKPTVKWIKILYGNNFAIVLFWEVFHVFNSAGSGTISIPPIQELTGDTT